VLFLAKKISGETRLLKEVIRDLSCDDAEARRKALDAVNVFAWKPNWEPKEFIDLGGLPALVKLLGEEDEKNRVQAVAAIERFAELGISSELVKEGVIPILERMVSSDRYEPLRMIAGKALAKIQGRIAK
jgi:hypothetical protein